MENKMMNLMGWAARNAVARSTARRWAVEGRLSGAYRTGRVWLVSEDIKPPIVKRGNPGIENLRAATLTQQAKLARQIARAERLAPLPPLPETETTP